MEKIVNNCYDHRGRIVTVTEQKNLNPTLTTLAFEGVDFIMLEKKDATAILDWLNKYELGRLESEPEYNIQTAHGEEFGLAHARLVDRLDGLIYPPKEGR